MSMDDKTSKQERDAARKEKHLLREATGNTYMKDVLDDLEDRPEEVGWKKITLQLICVEINFMFELNGLMNMNRSGTIMGLRAMSRRGLWHSMKGNNGQKKSCLPGHLALKRIRRERSA